jgi:hypothetical protein
MNKCVCDPELHPQEPSKAPHHRCGVCGQVWAYGTAVPDCNGKAEGI